MGRRQSFALYAMRKDSQRTNSTFGFLPTHKTNPKKPKELFLANA
jgi:hypothetical protein